MCFICDRINEIKNGTNPYFVRELETGYVVLGDNQHFRGYTLFLYKRHDGLTELFDLEPEERAKFMEKMYSDENRPTAEELEAMKRRLRLELDKLIPSK